MGIPLLVIGASAGNGYLKRRLDDWVRKVLSLIMLGGVLDVIASCFCYAWPWIGFCCGINFIRDL